MVYFRRMEQQDSWIAFLNSKPFIEALPYYLAQDMTKLMFQQVYKTNEIVYDVGDHNIDCLYFIYEGSVRMEA